MVMGFVLIPFGIRRELRLEDPEKYPTKPKKTRIWDEEERAAGSASGSRPSRRPQIQPSWLNWGNTDPSARNQ